MKKLQLFENFNNFKYQLDTGEGVRVNRDHIHKGALKMLPDALSHIEGGNKKFIKVTLKYDHVIGKTHCVTTTEDDIIYFQQRKKRKGKSRMVAKREPEDCNL